MVNINNINPRTYELSELLNEVFNKINYENLSYCVLRNYEHLPEYTEHDIDLLAKKEDVTNIILSFDFIISNT